MGQMGSDVLTASVPAAAMTRDHRLFALPASRHLGEAVAAKLGIELGELEVRTYEDGEHKLRPLDDVAGCRAVAVESLYGDDAYSVHDKLCRLLFLVGALHDAGANR